MFVCPHDTLSTCDAKIYGMIASWAARDWTRRERDNSDKSVHERRIPTGCFRPSQVVGEAFTDARIHCQLQGGPSRGKPGLGRLLFGMQDLFGLQGRFGQTISHLETVEGHCALRPSVSDLTKPSGSVSDLTKSSGTSVINTDRR